MQAKKMQQHIFNALDEAKAIDITVLDVRKLTDIADYMIIASGTSTRHVSATARKITDKMRELGVKSAGTEGETSGEWVLVDFGDVVVHVMHPQTRAFYNLEKLWSGDMSSLADMGKGPGIELVARHQRARK